VPLAFAVLARIEGASAETINSLVRLVADACGSVGMTGGQSIDLAAEGMTLGAAALEHMYALKTGALIHASVVSACILREDLDEAAAAALDGFGRDIGIAFQIKDDILDVEGETEVIGKPRGSDQKLGKATYPSLLGVEASHRRCDELLASALARLESFGHSATPLMWLARYIVERGN
jgi:geranylgeranyl pyrophosphate synthase